ncbi:uncharacterized protein [Henckelia pumila]|uniref:uncharacterized protein n=1 Tax=Henckelia pumila TaxID=405737 RepID=UPI003C6EA1D3
MIVHQEISLDMILKLVRVFGSVIYSSLSAQSPIGVDIEAEQRLERCNLCCVELEKVKLCLLACPYEERGFYGQVFPRAESGSSGSFMSKSLTFITLYTGGVFKGQGRSHLVVICGASWN